MIDVFNSTGLHLDWGPSKSKQESIFKALLWLIRPQLSTHWSPVLCSLVSSTTGKMKTYIHITMSRSQRWKSYWELTFLQQCCFSANLSKPACSCTLESLCANQSILSTLAVELETLIIFFMGQGASALWLRSVDLALESQNPSPFEFELWDSAMHCTNFLDLGMPEIHCDPFP